MQIVCVCICLRLHLVAAYVLYVYKLKNIFSSFRNNNNDNNLLRAFSLVRSCWFKKSGMRLSRGIVMILHLCRRVNLNGSWWTSCYLGIRTLTRRSKSISEVHRPVRENPKNLLISRSSCRLVVGVIAIIYSNVYGSQNALEILDIIGTVQVTALLGADLRREE